MNILINILDKYFENRKSKKRKENIKNVLARLDVIEKKIEVLEQLSPEDWQYLLKIMRRDI